MDKHTSFFGNTFYNKFGKDDGSSLKSVKLIALYDTHHSSLTNLELTNQLVEFYHELNKNGKVFEVFYYSKVDEV